MGRAFIAAFVALVGIEHQSKGRRWEVHSVVETTKDAAVKCGKQGLTLVVATGIANTFTRMVNR